MADLGKITDMAKLRELLAKRTEKRDFSEEALADILKKKVIGQDKVADQVCNQLKRRLAQVELTETKLDRPLGTFLLAGPPGVGKTYFCKVLAQNMYEGKGKLLHLDMTQFSQPHTKASLIGSVQGYSGGAGSLTSALDENPQVIVLLDEFEKAHDDIQKTFLTAWNDGFITDAHTSKRISTTKALFLLTTNAAMDRLVEIEQSYEGESSGRNKAVREALKTAGYAPEVLSRIDYTFVFAPLDQNGMARLASLDVQRLARQYGLTVAKIDTDYLVDLISQDEAFEGGGARELARVVDRQLGEQFIDAKDNGAKLVRISMIEGTPLVRIIEDK